MTRAAKNSCRPRNAKNPGVLINVKFPDYGFNIDRDALPVPVQLLNTTDVTSYATEFASADVSSVDLIDGQLPSVARPRGILLCQHRIPIGIVRA